MTTNGVCQKTNKDKSRVHDMRRKVDGAGRQYEACAWCGTMFVTVGTTKTNL